MGVSGVAVALAGWLVAVGPAGAGGVAVSAAGVNAGDAGAGSGEAEGSCWAGAGANCGDVGEGDGPAHAVIKPASPTTSARRRCIRRLSSAALRARLEERTRCALGLSGANDRRSDTHTVSAGCIQ